MSIELFTRKKKAFTYESNAMKLKSRIDFFLLAQPLSFSVKRAEVRSSIAPDYKAIFLDLEIQETFKRGPGYWKFNNRPLEDEEYIEFITSTFPKILKKHDNVNSKQLLWELIKMEIRTETMSHSKKKRKISRSREIILQERINALDREICNENGLNQELLDSYEAAKHELKEIYECKGKEAIFRYKAQWIEKGERPTKYFFQFREKEL